MLTAKLVEYSDQNTFLTSISEKIAERLRDQVKRDQKTTFVVSGGSTPKPLFDKLSNIDLPWAQIQVTLADERWVPPSHADSNQRLVREHLLVRYAAASTFIPLTPDTLSKYDPAKITPAVLAPLTSAPKPFACTLLGMGNDGHFASLFPCATQLPIGLTTDEALVTTQPTHAPYERISMSFKQILESDAILLMLTGEEKRNTLEKAIAALPDETMTIDDPLIHEMPIRALLQQTTTPVTIHWRA